MNSGRMKGMPLLPLLGEPLNANIQTPLSTVEISFENLLVVGYEDDSDGGESCRLPMSRLGLDENACVHGNISMTMAGRKVPHMGFFGPDDVCLWEWLGNWHEVESAFRAEQNASVVVGGAEQGEPAFVWEREGDTGLLTIADSELSGGRADLEWQKIRFSVAEFFAAHAQFREEAREFILREAPHCGLEWWDDWGAGRFDVQNV